MTGFLRGLAALAVVLLPNLALSQQRAPTFEILDDAPAMFSMTGEQWQENVRRRVAEGVASVMETPETGVAMVTRTAAGDLLVVRPYYIRGLNRPDLIQVTISYEPEAALFTDDVLEEAILGALRRMEPEYDVSVTVERSEGGVIVFFGIEEAAPDKGGVPEPLREN